MVIASSFFASSIVRYGAFCPFFNTIKLFAFNDYVIEWNNGPNRSFTNDITTLANCVPILIPITVFITV